MENVYCTITVIFFVMLSVSLIKCSFAAYQTKSINYFSKSLRDRLSGWICYNQPILTSTLILVLINMISIYSRVSNYSYWTDQQEIRAASPPPGTIIISDDQELNIAWHKSYHDNAKAIIDFGDLIVARMYADADSDNAEFVFCIIAFIARANQYMQKYGYNPDIDFVLTWLSDFDNPSVQLQLARAYADKDKWENR